MARERLSSRGPTMPVDNRCRARDMAYGRCDLQRRHEGPHTIELIEGVKRFRWDADGAKIEITAGRPLDSFSLTIPTKVS